MKNKFLQVAAIIVLLLPVFSFVQIIKAQQTLTLDTPTFVCRFIDESYAEKPKNWMISAKVTLNWNLIPSATFYNVYIINSAHPQGMEIGRFNASTDSLPYDVGNAVGVRQSTSPAGGDALVYRVDAYGSNGLIAQSNTAQVRNKWCQGDVKVKITLDGADYTGPISYDVKLKHPVNGYTSIYGSAIGSPTAIAAPTAGTTFRLLSFGYYRVLYLSGGPANATYQGDPPSQILGISEPTRSDFGSEPAMIMPGADSKPSLVFTLAFTSKNTCTTVNVSVPVTGTQSAVDGIVDEFQYYQDLVYQNPPASISSPVYSYYSPYYRFYMFLNGATLNSDGTVGYKERQQPLPACAQAPSDNPCHFMDPDTIYTIPGEGNDFGAFRDGACGIVSAASRTYGDYSHVSVCNSTKPTLQQKTVCTTDDTQAPTVPSNLRASVVSTSQINLSWSASTDDVAIAGYKVYRNGTQVGTATVTSYQSTGLSAATAYTYTVSAFDAARNNSAQSASVSATTNSAAPPAAPGFYVGTSRLDPISGQIACGLSYRFTVDNYTGGNKVWIVQSKDDLSRHDGLWTIPYDYKTVCKQDEGKYSTSVYTVVNGRRGLPLGTVILQVTPAPPAPSPAVYVLYGTLGLMKVSSANCGQSYTFQVDNYSGSQVWLEQTKNGEPSYNSADKGLYPVPSSSTWVCNRDEGYYVNKVYAVVNGKKGKSLGEVDFTVYGAGGVVPSCNISWSEPRAADGKGLRQISQPANYSLSLSNFTPSSTVYIINKNLDNHSHNSAPLKIDQGGNYSVSGDQTLIKASEYSVGTYSTGIYDANNKLLASCNSFVIVPATPQCTITWSSPTTSDGKGVRQVGQPSNEDVVLTGFQPSTKVTIKNTNLDNGSTRTAPVTIKEDGTYSVKDHTLIKEDEYSVGNYSTEILGASNNNLATCKSFVIVAPTAAPGATSIISATPNTLNIGSDNIVVFEGTGFTLSTITVSNPSAVTVSDIAVNQSRTVLRATFHVSQTATPGPLTVTISSIGQTAQTILQLVQKKPGAPTITFASALATRNPGEIIVQINGQNFQNATADIIGAPVSVTSQQVNQAGTQITVILNVSTLSSGIGISPETLAGLINKAFAQTSDDTTAACATNPSGQECKNAQNFNGARDTAANSTDNNNAPPTATTTATGFEGICSKTAGLPKCIQQLYLLALGLGALVAVLMIVLAGYRYMTASGNAQQVESAKDAFTSAFIGLIIIFVAYILLYLINPDLVTFRNF
jgi:hypothetical protein